VEILHIPAVVYAVQGWFILCRCRSQYALDAKKYADWVGRGAINAPAEADVQEKLKK
jgi:hypothetical protein